MVVEDRQQRPASDRPITSHEPESGPSVAPGAALTGVVVVGGLVAGGLLAVL